MIIITPHTTQLEPIINNIQIKSSTFYVEKYSRRFFHSKNVNTVVNQQLKIDEYYRYDRIDLCRMTKKMFNNRDFTSFLWTL